MRLQLLLAGSLVNTLFHCGSAVPQSLTPENATDGEGMLGDNITWMAAYVKEVDAQATAQIHYAATALSNRSKTALDGVLPQIQTVAKHYGL